MRFLSSFRLQSWFYCFLAVLIFCPITCLRAQTVWDSYSQPSVSASPLALDRGSTGLWQTLQKLRTRASILMIVAHPDDEDSGLLAYESRGQGARTILLTLNRGEGGQNVMSSAFWDALGVLRTEELLAADRYYGVRQYFTQLVDFGFSKTLAESMSQWGHERTLRDVVRVVRMTRPLVIVSVWVGGHSDGHGQHEVSGEIAQEAFEAAANPNMFPGQIRAGLLPWRALKYYARVPFATITPKGMYDYADRHWYPVGVYDYIHHRSLPGIPSTTVQVPEGQYNPLIGRSYAQIGAEGLDCQKSQNGGVAIPPLGARESRYHRYAPNASSGTTESSFFEGIDTSLAGIADLAPGEPAAFLKQGLDRISHQVHEAFSHFSATHPEDVAPALALGLKDTNELIAGVRASSLHSKYNVDFELRVKRNEFSTALLQALGVSMRAWVVPKPAQTRSLFGTRLQPVFPWVVPGQTFWVEVRMICASGAPVTLQDVRLASTEGEQWAVEAQGPRGGALPPDKPFIVFFKVTVPANAASTKPYYSRDSIETPFYHIDDPRDRNRPFGPYPLSAWAQVGFQGARIHLGEVVQTAQRERGRGEVMQPLAVAPAVSVSVSPRAGVIPLATPTTSLTVTVRSDVMTRAHGAVHLKVPAGWTASPTSAPFDIAKAGEDQRITFRVAANGLRNAEYTIDALARFRGRDYGEGFETIGYPGLRPYNDYQTAVYRAVGVEIGIPKNLSVGYVPGTGDHVAQALASVGIRVKMLSSQDLASGRLNAYDAIVLGVRSYAARSDLTTYNARLLSYVKNGGILIVQYNTPEYDHDYGPYPYKLTQDPEVVVDEHSRVNILLPSNPVLGWPNRITERDFDGWVEERGHGFMTAWDPHYQALLETHDPNQPPQNGGLLYARYGKGVYIYDAYAFYRQLPQGVPGAYRLFVNMVSLARNPKRQAVN
jgi:LmbE family N-acetylglucosaminyl deacetylase